MRKDNRRSAERVATSQKVICRNSSGIMPDVWLADLAISGCQVIVRNGALEVGQRVVVRPDGLEGLPGVVRWVEAYRAGIEFGTPLHPSVMQHLLRSKLSAPEVACLVDHGFVDQFGRPLPPLPPLTIFRSVA